MYSAPAPGSDYLDLEYRHRDGSILFRQHRHVETPSNGGMTEEVGEAAGSPAVEPPEAQNGCLQSAGSRSVTFSVGDKFGTFQELENALESYKKECFVDFWKRDSRTIEASRKRGVDRPLKSKLKYFELRYCCIHGGQRFKPRRQGVRSTS